MKVQLAEIGKADNSAMGPVKPPGPHAQQRVDTQISKLGRISSSTFNVWKNI